MTVVKSHIRMQKFSTKHLKSVTDFATCDGTNSLLACKMSNCGIGTDGLHTTGKFVKVNDKQVISACVCDGVLYTTSGYDVCAIDSEGNCKELLTFKNYQGKDCRLYGDSLHKKVVFSGIGGVYFTDGTTGNADSELYDRKMSAIAFAENRIVGAADNTVYLSDAMSSTFVANEKPTTAATFSVGDTVTALCGVNNDVYVFAERNMYKITVGYAPTDFTFVRVAANIGTVRFAVYYHNKMYCFCDEGLRTTDNGVKTIAVLGKALPQSNCQPIVWRDRIVFADGTDIVMFDPQSGHVDIVALSARDLAVVGDELYAVSDYRLYKYDEKKSACGTFVSSPCDFGDNDVKSLRAAILSGCGRVNMSVIKDGVVCANHDVTLVDGKTHRLPCYGTGREFVVRLSPHDGARVRSLTLQADFVRINKR